MHSLSMEGPDSIALGCKDMVSWWSYVWNTLVKLCLKHTSQMWMNQVKLVKQKQRLNFTVAIMSHLNLNWSLLIMIIVVCSFKA